MKYITATRHKGSLREETVKLKLTARLLREEVERGEIRMQMQLSDIKDSFKREMMSVVGYWVDDPEGNSVTLDFSPSRREIGCCSFSNAEFSKLLKAAKAK